MAVIVGGAFAQSSAPNTTCPVMTGEPVKDTVFEDYQGQRVYFCCTKCQAKFRASPAKYVANLPQFAGASSSSPSSVVPPPPPESLSLLSRVFRFLGRLHPLVVHFPIALLIVAGLLVGTGITRQSRAAREAMRFCLVLGALGAALAASLGWLNAHYERGGLSGDTPDLGIHRWLGVAVALVSGMAAVVVLASKPSSVAAPYGGGGWGSSRGGRRAGARGVLIIVSGLGLAALVGVTGHFGGLTAYGSNYLWEAFGATSTASTPPTSAPIAGDSPVLIEQPAAANSPGPAAPPAVVIPANIKELLYNSSDLEVLKIRRAARLAEIAPPPGPEADPHDRAATEIDRYISQAWRKAGLPQADAPPPLCDDAAFLRRVYLDVIGVIPTIEEADRFMSDDRADKRALLIDELLARDQDYADHWTPFWEDALGSSNVQLQGGVPTRGNYRMWIHESFRENKPFDVFAAQLIDTEMPGAKKPEIAEANSKKSRVSYIRNETHTDTLQSAAAVAQVFMGTGMKCASCHSHFENDEWPQKRFLGFAGLFGPHDLELIRCEKKSGEFVPAKFAFDLPGTPTATPEDELGRLRRAAQLLTDPQNPRFTKAIVNRLWKRYMGLGLFEPVDDFRLNVPPSHPELLEWLAYDFMSHGYDVKHTMRLILGSRTYQTAYDSALEDHFDIAKKTEPRYFRSPTLRRLTAEQVVDSMRVAAAQRLDPATRLYHIDKSTALSRSLGKPASRNEISTLRPDDTAVVQALELLNGEEFNGLVYSSAILAGAAEEVRGHENAGAADEAIVRLYRAVFTRPPRENELSVARSFLQASVPATAAPAPPREITLIDDDTPPNARLTGEWNWVLSPVSKGKRAHQQSRKDKPAQHYAVASSGSPVSPLDTLYVDVYLDPDDPPKEVMIQWNDGTMDDGGWPHRAYWGEDLVTFGRGANLIRQHIGELPGTGHWVHLEVPAAQVGFTTNGRIVGMSFDQFGGTVTFDNAGLVHRDAGPEYQALGDLLWALVSSPEFHYIR
jgi:uncharacterized membrane protein